MTAKTRKTLVMMTLPIAIIWAVFNYPSDKETIEFEDDYEEEVIQPIAAGPDNSPRPDPRLIDIESETQERWGKDPFRLEKQVKLAPIAARNEVGWELSGIIYSPVDPIAFINGKSVRKGDLIADAKVTDIDKRSVTLLYQGRQFTLSINKG
ncbi:hypothetical protein GF377_04875 [candidate division GN15 bacterium]|nr:hypothetical protein [candidate division GN15 bacterium]